MATQSTREMTFRSVQTLDAKTGKHKETPVVQLDDREKEKSLVLEVLTGTQLLGMFKETIETMSKIADFMATDPYIVVFENGDMWSSNCGAQTAMVVGPGRTYQEPYDVIGAWLYDLPSQRQYPRYIWIKAEER